MSKLAAEYGISGNGLVKICDRLEVPYPPRGYWAKKAARRNVVVFKLQHADPSTPQVVRITPTVKQMTEVHFPENDTVNQVCDVIGEIAVPKRLTRPHPIIADLIADNKHRREEATLDSWRHRRSPVKLSDSEKRRHRTLDALFKAIEKHGGKYTCSSERMDAFE